MVFGDGEGEVGGVEGGGGGGGADRGKEFSLARDENVTAITCFAKEHDCSFRCCCCS